jgi:hypothetical protein
MSNYDQLFWDEPRIRLRGSTAAEMDEELREREADPWDLYRNVRLRSDGTPVEEGEEKLLLSSNPIEDFAVAHSDEIEPEDRKWLGKLFRRHRERLHKPHVQRVLQDA